MGGHPEYDQCGTSNCLAGLFLLHGVPPVQERPWRLLLILLEPNRPGQLLSLCYCGLICCDTDPQLAESTLGFDLPDNFVGEDVLLPESIRDHLPTHQNDHRNRERHAELPHRPLDRNSRFLWWLLHFAAGV